MTLSQKILVVVQVFTASLLFAQSTPPKAPAPAPQPNTRPSPPEAFTELESATAQEIQRRQQAVQQLINDFMVEVKQRHPGYEFRNGSLVAIPKAEDKAQKPEEKK